MAVRYASDSCTTCHRTCQHKRPLSCPVSRTLRRRSSCCRARGVALALADLTIMLLREVRARGTEGSLRACPPPRENQGIYTRRDCNDDCIGPVRNAARSRPAWPGFVRRQLRRPEPTETRKASLHLRALNSLLLPKRERPPVYKLAPLARTGPDDPAQNVVLDGGPCATVESSPPGLRMSRDPRLKTSFIG